MLTGSKLNSKILNRVNISFLLKLFLQFQWIFFIILLFINGHKHFLEHCDQIELQNVIKLQKKKRVLRLNFNFK